MMLHKLGRLAVEVHNLAVVVTNQVQSQPDDFSAGRDGLRAAGGNVMGDARILLYKGNMVPGWRHGMVCLANLQPNYMDVVSSSGIWI